MNKLFLINDEYYVIAFDYYDAITIFQKFNNYYNEDVIEKIEFVDKKVISKNSVRDFKKEYEEEEEEDDE